MTESSRASRLTRRSGSLFTSECQTLVNTVNCRGVMGAGIALEFRRRYPAMFSAYESKCQSGDIRVGQLWLYKEQPKWILCFPTKRHWKDPSRIGDIRAGLESFEQTYMEMGIKSTAFPLLGTMHGGLPVETSRSLMEHYLSKCSIPIEVWDYDPEVADDLLPILARKLMSADAAGLHADIGVSLKSIEVLEDAIRMGSIYQLSQAERLPGIGSRAMDKLYAYAVSLATKGTLERTHLTLFDNDTI